MSLQNSYRWKILIVTCVCMVSFAMVFQSIPPVLTMIILEFGISHAQAGLLMSLFALPSIFVAIPGGMFSEHLGVKKTGMISLVLMIVGTFTVGISGTFLQVCIGRTISGTGAYILAVICPQLVSEWFFDRELEFGMGIFSSAIPMGTILSLNVLGVLGKVFGWRMAILFTAIFSITSLLIFMRLLRKPTKTGEKIKNVVPKHITKLGSSIWLVGFSYAGFMAAFTSFLTFSPAFFVAKGYEVGSASSISSIVMIAPLILSPLIGYFAQKFGREEILVGIGGVFMATFILFFRISSFYVSSLALIGISAALTRAPIHSLTPKAVDSEYLGLAFGIMTMCLNIGVMIGPYLAGLVKDHTGDFALSFLLMTFFAILQTVSIGIFSFVKK